MDVNVENVYVDVAAVFMKDGKILPKVIYWEDGREFEIEKITDMRYIGTPGKRCSGIAYTCTVLGQERHLYCDRNFKWYVERITVGQVRKGA